MTAILDIQLGGSRYPVACSEGEAARITQIGEELQSRLTQLRAGLGDAQVSDAHLLALMGLILMDELAEAKLAAVPAPVDSAQNGEEIFINAVSHLTDRVNLIARRLKAA